jgi:GNAT superfamily N-acetyltransferase
VTAAVTVQLVPAGAAGDDAFLSGAVELINRVYADAERGLWRDGVQRTDRAEVAAIVRAGELAVARLDGALVGAVRVQRLDDRLGEFGMLVADPAYRGVGVGRALVTFAEAWAREQRLDRMQLEVLVPRTWHHPVKEFVRAWYTRLGYRHVRTDRLADAYPQLPPLLATPCDFLIYHKPLAA